MVSNGFKMVWALTTQRSRVGKGLEVGFEGRVRVGVWVSLCCMVYTNVGVRGEVLLLGACVCERGGGGG